MSIAPGSGAGAPAASHPAFPNHVMRRAFPAQGTRTWNVTLPLAPGASEPVSVHTIAPAPPAGGCELTAQPVSPAPSVAHAADWKTVNAREASLITMLQIGAG